MPSIFRSSPPAFIFPSVAEQFEEDDDPEAFLDESSSASREYEEAKISTSASLTDHSFIPSNTNL